MSNAIRLVNPTHRNTRAHRLEIGPYSFYFSYETCIAYSGPDGAFRIANSWGPTTGRHFKELNIADFELLADEAFDARLTKTLGKVAA